MTASSYDLLVREARLLDGTVTDIGVLDGMIAAMAPALGGAADRVIAADGGLVTPRFVNGHLHLDKVYTLPRLGDAALTAYTDGSMGSAMTAIELAAAVKRDYDRSWLVPNIRRALDAAVAYGTGHILAFADVDTTGGLEGMAAVLEARAAYVGVLDIQVVAFPQDGLLRDDGAAALCEEALAMGADVVGGIPWIEHTDADARAHVEWACELAARTGRRVAMLVDDAGDPGLRTTEMLAEAMIRHSLVGRGTACHARAVGRYERPTLLRLLALARRAGLGFVSDPHTGPLHLPVREVLAAGLPVALGQDDIEDGYYPFGRHNMLEVAFLAAHLLGFGSDPDQRRLLDLVTDGAAQVMGVPSYGLSVGSPAGLCVHGPDRVVDLLREHAAPRFVVAGSRVVASTETTTMLDLGGG
jgi:cytosine deaminase